MLFVQSEGTAARRRAWVYLVDVSDGLTPETGEAGGQPQISKNGAAWGNTSATLTDVGNGTYYVELTAAELDTLGKVFIRYKSANTAEFSTVGDVVAVNVHIAPGASGGLFIAGINAATTAASLTVTGDFSIGNDFTIANNITFNDVTGGEVSFTGGLILQGVGMTIGGESNVAQTGDSYAVVSTTGAVVGSHTTAAKAEINAEVVDCLNVDTYAEIGQETPAATNTIRKMLGYLFKAWRNKKTQTSSTYSLFADDASTVDQKATVSDDGATTTVGEVSTGP